MEIVTKWRNQIPPGRFLKFDSSANVWNDVGNEMAEKKTQQALMELPPVGLPPAQAPVAHFHSRVAHAPLTQVTQAPPVGVHPPPVYNPSRHPLPSFPTRPATSIRPSFSSYPSSNLCPVVHTQYVQRPAIPVQPTQPKPILLLSPEHRHRSTANKEKLTTWQQNQVNEMNESINVLTRRDGDFPVGKCCLLSSIVCVQQIYVTQPYSYTRLS